MEIIDNKLVNCVEELVIKAAKSDKNKFGFGIWTHHIKSVVEYGEKIAIKRNADIEIVIISCLLHDYASLIDYSLYADHHIHGAEKAEEILKRFHYPPSKIEKVKRCIVSHRGSKKIEKTTVEETCVSDADAISHIVQVPSLLYLTYKEKGLGIDEGRSFVKEKLSRSWNKISPETKEMIEEEYIAALKILG